MTIKIPIFDGSIDIEFHLNQKCVLSQFILIWNTSEEPMLRAILSKFISEKVLIKGINSRNNIVNAFVGKSGVMIYAPDNKFFSILKQIYNAIFTSTVKVAGDYGKLVKDVKKGARIICTGKIKTLMKHLGKGSPKIETFKKTVKDLKIKDRLKNVYTGRGSVIQENIQNLKLQFKSKGAKHSFSESNKYDLSILLSRCPVPFWFEGEFIYSVDIDSVIDSIQTSNPNLLKTVQYQVKKDDEENLKVLGKMFSILYHFKESKSTPDESKKAISQMIISD